MQRIPNVHSILRTHSHPLLHAQEFLPLANQTMTRGDFKRKHLSSPLLKEFIDTHCIMDPYKIEVCIRDAGNRHCLHLGELTMDIFQVMKSTTSSVPSGASSDAPASQDPSGGFLCHARSATT